MAESGRVVAVTGALGGIGAAIASTFAERGYRVAVLDLNGEAAAEAAKNLGNGAIGVGVNIADRQSVTDAVTTVTQELGAIEVLVNNAGIDIIKPFLESTEEEWERIVAVNYLGTVRMTRAVLDGGMVAANWGRIVSIASDAGRVGSSGEVVYSGTKGGVIAFSKALAREVARYAITVNVVCPGPTETPLLDQVKDASEKLYASLSKAMPMRRLGKPADIAPAVAFLAADSSDYITGQTLSVSGGLTMA